MSDKAYEIALNIVGEEPDTDGDGRYYIPCPVPTHADGVAVIYMAPDKEGIICYCSKCGGKAPWHQLKQLGYIKGKSKRQKIDKDTGTRNHVETIMYRDGQGADYMQAVISDYFDKHGVFQGRAVSHFDPDNKRIKPTQEGIFLNLWEVRMSAENGLPIYEVQDEIDFAMLSTASTVTCFPFNRPDLRKWCASKPWDQFAGCEYVAIIPHTGSDNLKMARKKAEHYYHNGVPAKVIDLVEFLGVDKDADLGVAEVYVHGRASDLWDYIDAAPIFLPPDDAPRPADVIEMFPAEADRVISEKAVSEMVISNLKERALFVAEKNEWFLHTGQVYAIDRLGSRTFNLISDYLDKELPVKIRSAQIQHEIQRRAIAAYKEKAKVNNIMSFVKASNTASVDDFDSDPLVINTKNLILDLNSGDIKARVAKPGDRCLKIAGFSFNAKAKCPRWLEFQKWLFDGDEERMAWNQFWAGYCLLGITSHQIVRMNKGTGANGKSLDSNVRMAIGGSYAAPIMSRVFLAKKFDTQLDSLSQLLGIRHGVVSELPANGRLDDATIKDLSGGDVLKVRFLRQEPQDMIVQVKLEFRTNFEPDASTDDGLHRRLRWVPYRNVATKEMQIPNFDKILLANERDGIGFWALQGALMLLDQGRFPDSAEIDKESADYRNDNDKVAQFVECWVRKDAPAGRSMRQSTVHQYYSAWCKEEGITYVISPNNLAKELERMGYKRGATTGYPTIKGIAIHPEIVNEHSDSIKDKPLAGESND